MAARTFAVVRWDPERDGPSGPEHLGRVCEIIGEGGHGLWLRTPDGQMNVSADQVLVVGELPFGEGDQVRLADGRIAEIVDCVWHYSRSQPMYFLGFDRKLSNRRYFSDELSAVQQD